MKKNKFYTLIITIIAVLLCLTQVSCTDRQMDMVVDKWPGLVFIIVTRLRALDFALSEYYEQDEFAGQNESLEEIQNKWDDKYYDELNKRLEFGSSPNDGNNIAVVGTNDNYKPANTNTNKEGNPNTTIGGIGGQGNPEVSSVTLHGYLTGLEAHPLTITIYFTTGAVEGSFYHSAEGNCMIWDMDDKGNMIPGTKQKVYARYEIKGKITGWLNLKTYAITGDMTCTGSAVYKGKVYPMDEPGKVSGYLDKNNNLSCTVDNGYNIKASP
jgi:hypothetical protein